MLKLRKRCDKTSLVGPSRSWIAFYCVAAQKFECWLLAQFQVGPEKLQQDSGSTTACVLVGEWAQDVIHPSKSVTKEYIVTFSRDPTNAELEALLDGCEIDGALVQPVSIAYAARDRKDKLRIVVSEGRNREVHQLHPLLSLKIIPSGVNFEMLPHCIGMIEVSP